MSAAVRRKVDAGAAGAVLAGGALTGGIGAWLTGALMLGRDPGATGAMALEALLIVQLLAVWIAPAWLTGPGARRRGCISVALLVTVPWPLLALLRELGAAGAWQLAWSQLLALTVGLASLLVTTAPGFRRRPAVTLTLQIVPALAIWSTREVWLTWQIG